MLCFWEYEGWYYNYQYIPKRNPKQVQNDIAGGSLHSGFEIGYCIEYNLSKTPFY